MEQTGYHVVLEPDPEGGYVAVVPAFPGCYSQGETAEEALSNARSAILLTIEDMRERGDAIPDPAGELIRNASARRWPAWMRIVGVRSNERCSSPAASLAGRRARRSSPSA